MALCELSSIVQAGSWRLVAARFSTPTCDAAAAPNVAAPCQHPANQHHASITLQCHPAAPTWLWSSQSMVSLTSRSSRSLLLLLLLLLLLYYTRIYQAR